LCIEMKRPHESLDYHMD